MDMIWIINWISAYTGTFSTLKSIIRKQSCRIFKNFYSDKLNGQLIMGCAYNDYWDFYILMVSNVATPSKWQITRNKADVDGHEVRQ